MREIKFRCWNRECKEMYAWEIMCDDGLNNYMSEDDIWLQYTGMKDKNGVEIYDGDILTVDHPEEHTFKTKVFYENGCPCGNAKDAYYLADIPCLYELSGYAEVIGNIYEHPELIS